MTTTDYDNAFNGAVFPTNEFGIMAGPFELSEGTKARAVLEKDGCGTGLHSLSVYRQRRDGSLGKQLYTGLLRRYKSDNPKAPIAIGFISSGKQRIEVCAWLKSDLVDKYYQIKPDWLRSERAEPFDI